MPDIEKTTEGLSDDQKRLLEIEGEQIVRDLAGHVGNQISEIVQRHALTARTVAGAFSIGVLAAAQVLNEATQFARNSMDEDDEKAIVSHFIFDLFISQIHPELRAYLAEQEQDDAN